MHTRSRGSPPVRNLLGTGRGEEGDRFIPRSVLATHRARPHSIFRTTCTFLPQASPLVLCSGGAVILYFPTDYNPREKRVTRGGEMFYGCWIVNYSRLPTIHRPIFRFVYYPLSFSPLPRIQSELFPCASFFIIYLRSLDRTSVIHTIPERRETPFGKSRGGIGFDGNPGRKIRLLTHLRDLLTPELHHLHIPDVTKPNYKRARLSGRRLIEIPTYVSDRYVPTLSRAV